MANNMQAVAKISGYLDKKARLRIGSPWKKYWFVLEGRLLLYYRSKDEYETLSPCKGSINLCPPCNIHPSSSTNCIFQIQCRANTVTLRAENRSDQDKWMQALLAAIDQSKSSPTRMSHFRYSLDDLPTPTKGKNKSKNEFIRQNSMPHRTSSKTSENMIDRLQKIGVHTYGGSLETIVRLGTKKDLYENEAPEGSDSQNLNFLYAKISEPDSVSPNQLHNNNDRHSNFIIENDQYSIIQEESSIDMLSHVEPSKTSSVEMFVENQQYAGCDEINSSNENTIVENDQYASSDIKEDCVRRNNLERPKIEHLYERISRDSEVPYKGDRDSLNVGNLYEALPDSINVNDQYSVVQKRDSMKKPNKTEDYNKNSLIIDNDQYISNRNSADSATYSEAQIIPNYIEYDTIDKTVEQETIYEDPDTIKKNRYDPKIDEYQYVEPLLPPRPDSKRSEEETSSQTSSQDNKIIKKKKKLFRMFHKIEKKSELNAEVKKPKIKKRTHSFLKKMWRRKTKSLDNGEEDVIYESVDYELVKKQVAHQCDIEMLEELEKILQTRKDMLQQKLKSYENKLNSDRKEITARWAKKTTENKTGGVNETCNDSSRPSLPPRQNSQASLSNRLETLKENENGENVKSIDEILQDLDNETRRSKKVKELIDKFNDIQNIAQAVQIEQEEDVKRRKPNTVLTKSPSDTKVMEMIKAKRDSGDELNKLLEQLAKVTYAPIMSPGVTSSLITPVISDEEWLNLIPIRRRRSSDPDYDVPRPHSSLQILERSRPNSDNPIPVTRFFGPILPQSQSDAIVTLRSSTSMDPDSLEAHNNLLENIESSALESLNESSMEREHSISCTPHNNYIHHDHAIYAYPKNLFSSNINNNHILDEMITKRLDNSEVIKNNNNAESPLYQSTFALELKPEEVFADSLEPITEISTVF